MSCEVTGIIPMRTMRKNFEDFCRHLATDCQIEEKSKDFAALDSNLKMVNYTYNLVLQIQKNLEFYNVGKNISMSEKFRREGNLRFKDKNHNQAISMYNSAIVAAPIGSEQYALGFANRSAVLIENGRYKECLADIDVALNGNYPEDLKPKLIKRKEAALKLVGKQTPLVFHEKLPEIKEKNKNIQCASNSLEIKCDNIFGRHVLATKDIEVGEILAIENPYTVVPAEDSKMSHCHYCLSLCLYIFPCETCISCIYCSETCKKNAWDEYHQHECKIMGSMLGLSVSKLSHLALRVSIKAKPEYNNITNYKAQGTIYESERYEEIHKLSGNTHLRNISDLFYRAYEAALLFHLMKKKTEFFETALQEEIFKEILIHHLQTGPSNFHEVSDLAESNSGCYLSEEIGGGPYSLLSLINHSCNPNVVRHCYGRTIVLRALTPIIKGEQIFDNYGYHFAIHGKDERQIKLKDQYLFSCACIACKEDWPTFFEQNYKDLAGMEDFTEDLIDKLKTCDIVTAKTNMVKLENMAQSLNEHFPCKELCKLQEALKQCYSILGSKRIYKPIDIF